MKNLSNLKGKKNSRNNYNLIFPNKENYFFSPKKNHE